MCGILGQLKKNGINSGDLEIFQGMLNMLKKRGPDQEGIYTDKKIILGHKRLSIIDLSEAGRQPMFNEDKKIAIVFNGEIYNYQGLKQNLKQKHSWQSRTDTEVLIHGYEEFGQKIVEKIEGMFAFGIYDKEKEILTLARDHFGKKPLYYYHDQDIFCFASELKALIMNPEIKKKLSIDQASLTKYLFYGYIPSPNTIFEQIKKLEPATTFQFDIKKWKIINKYRFWRLEDIKLNNNISEKEILEKTEKLFKDAVSKRLMADVPLGVFLSGGVDSSIIAYYLSQNSSNVNSFTVCYKDSPSADESFYAERVAKSLGINYHLCQFEDNLVESNFLEIIDYLDEPMADAAIIPLHFISKFAKKNITVALSGDGGDEVFGGYEKYKAQKFVEDYKYFGFLAGLLGSIIPKGNNYSRFLKVFGLDFPIRQFIWGSGGFLPNEIKNLLNLKSLDLNQIFSEAIDYSQEFKQNDIINKSLYLDCKILLPDWYLVKGDRATMCNSLEMRNPFLDKNMAEFLFSLSGKWKVRNGVTKYVLKKIAAQYIDPQIIYRPKGGFGVPLDKWIKTELKPLFEEYLFKPSPFFNRAYVEKIFRQHLSGQQDNQFLLLRIFNLNYFLNKYHAS